MSDNFESLSTPGNNSITVWRDMDGTGVISIGVECIEHPFASLFNVHLNETQAEWLANRLIGQIAKRREERDGD